MTYAITANEQYNSLEVTFDAKPDSSVIAALKALRMRWHAKKACWSGFATREQIESAINGTQPEQTEPAPPSKTRKPAKQADPVKRTHSVKVGDLFYTSWGYEQTNVDFFQVIELRGASSALVRQVCPELEEEAGVSSMAADRSYKIPSDLLPPARSSVFISDQEHGDLRRIQISKYNGQPYFKVGRPGHYQDTAYPYDGRKLYESWYY